MTRSRSIAIAAFVLLLSAPGFGHELHAMTDDSISTWSMKDGLPSSVVWSIA